MHIWISAFKKGDVIMKKWVKKLSALIIITAIIIVVAEEGLK